MKRIRKIGFTNFILLISSLVLAIILISFSFVMNAESATGISDSWKVKNTVRRMASAISNIENRKLAYVFTRQIRYKHELTEHFIEYDALREEVEAMVSHNGPQLEQLRKVDSLVDKHFADFNKSLNEEGFTALEMVTESKEEMLNAEQIRSYLGEIIDIEDTFLEQRIKNYDLWMFLIIAGILIATFIVGLSLYNLINRIKPLVEELVETKENLEASNRSLNITLEELNNLNTEKELEIRAKEKAIMETELLNDSLSAKNQQLDHFAYVASHDLQEPLRTVSNYLEVFQEDFPERLEGEASLYFDFINSAVERMRNLISGLLSFSRIGTSGEMEQIDLNATLSKIQDDLSILIEERNITFEIDSLPTIEGYRIEIKQLFQNLISNAIKFTDPKINPKVKISFDETDNFYNFHLQDNGIGMSNNNIGKIFDMFSRLHNSKEYGGQGIGLAFCKKIVELHHGNIWVTSKPGKGSTFHFTIKK